MFREQVLPVFDHYGIKHQIIDAINDDIEVQHMKFETVRHMAQYFAKGAVQKLYIHDIRRTEDSVEFFGIV